MAETMGRDWDTAYRIDFTRINAGAGFQKKKAGQFYSKFWRLGATEIKVGFGLHTFNKALLPEKHAEVKALVGKIYFYAL